jgi:hypothetical protein
MTKERKTTTPNPNDPNDTLIRGPIVQGKIAGARMIGEAIIKKGKGYSDTAPFSDEYFEYVAAAIRLTHFLKGFYDAIEEVLGGGLLHVTSWTCGRWAWTILIQSGF